ncbi:MAG: hypothetical protein WAN66_10445 [Limnoraphis robusta]
MPDENQRDLAKQLAKQGDPKAIASAINHSLKPKGINADVMRDNGCLHVMLEGEQVPNNQKALVSFIENGMKRLDIDSVYTVKIYGRQFGDDIPLWEDEIILKIPPEESLDLDEEPIPPMPQFDFNDDEEENLNDDHIPEGVLPQEVIISDDDDEDNYAFDDESVDDEDYDDNLEANYNPEEDDDLEEETERVPPNNKGKILLFVLLVTLLAIAALAGLHFSGIYKLPFLSGGSSESEVEPSTPEETPPETSGETPASPPPTATETPSDPWAEAVRSAISAANLAQTAQSRTEWESVASQWGQAVELMKQVPESSPNYQTAQQKATEYERNRQVALQRAAGASN